MYLTLNSDEKIRCYPPSELFEADKSKEIVLAMDNHELRHGFIIKIDNFIHIPTRSGWSIKLPFDRLVAWFYREDYHGVQLY